MELQKEIQESAVSAEVPALIAAVRPILTALLLSLKDEVVERLGGHENIKLWELARMRAPNDGELGVCFEYAVHDAILNGDPEVIDRINTALHKFCKIKGDEPQSLLFGAEKSGKINLIDSVADALTPESRLLSGSRGQPVKLKKHIQTVASAFRMRADRAKLPASINDLWKADLFVGRMGPDQWVGTTVKVNPTHLQGAKGLRLAVVPSTHGKSDKITHDDARNLIVVPMPYDQMFMEVFLGAWQTVVQVMNKRGEMPRPVDLYRPAQIYVAQQLVERREFAVVDIIDALGPLAQPYLLATRPAQLTLDLYRDGEGNDVRKIISPFPGSF